MFVVFTLKPLGCRWLVMLNRNTKIIITYICTYLELFNNSNCIQKCDTDHDGDIYLNG